MAVNINHLVCSHLASGAVKTAAMRGRRRRRTFIFGSTLGSYWARIWSWCSTHLLHRLLYCEPNIISIGEYMRVRLPYIDRCNRNVDLSSHTLFTSAYFCVCPGYFSFCQCYNRTQEKTKKGNLLLPFCQKKQYILDQTYCDDS